jgi:hypothetical protein
MRIMALAVALCAVPMIAGAAEALLFQCKAPPDIWFETSPLPHTTVALHDRDRLKIVAMGSLSTAGAGSAPATSWPIRLGEALKPLLPGVAIEVVNKARPKQMAAHMLAKMKEDVLAERPDLVIWETGTIEAIKSVNIEEYEATLTRGVDLFARAGIDTILMDPQFSRASASMIDFDRYVDAAHRVAEMRDLIVFPRFRIMHYWISEGLLSFEAATTRPSQVALADQIYDCLGKLLARMIADQVSMTVGANKP